MAQPQQPGELGDAHRDERDTGLKASLSSLSQLSSTQFGLREFAARVAAIAVRAIPGADGAGLILLESQRPNLTAESAEFVGRVDSVQYELGEGPCISVAATGRAMRSGSLGGDHRWPRFGPRAGRLGVHSVLSLPLHTPAGLLGAVHVYALAKNAFDERAEQVGQQFATPAAVSVLNAQILAQSQRLSTQLQAALKSRPIIDQAIGVLRSRSGDTADEAFARLRGMSQTEHRKLHEVAANIVEQAAARARARR